MFNLFSKKKKTTPVVPAQKEEKHDKYEVFRMMSPEDLENEAQQREAEAEKLATRWNHMSISEKDENINVFYDCLNLRREAEFFRRLKSDFNARAPELFEGMIPEASDEIQPYKWGNELE